MADPRPQRLTNASGEWEYVDLTDEEIAAGEARAEAVDADVAPVRAQRNALLVSSDWTQLPDSALSTDKQNEWKTYRQALRDITNGFSKQSEVTWPTQPS